MKRILCHFPIFLFWIFLLHGCKDQDKKCAKSDAKYDASLAQAEQFVAKKRYDSAFFFYNKIKNDLEISVDRRVYALINMAEIQRLYSDFAGSEATITEVLPHLNKTKSDFAPSVYNLLGITYKEQSDYNNAIKYYNLTFKKTKDALQQAIVLNNIAVVYMEEQDFKKAIATLIPLLQLRDVKADTITNARIFDNLGYCYFKNGQVAEGLKFLNSGLKLRRELKDDFGLVPSYIHLAEFYEVQDRQLSNQFAAMAYQTATKINSADDRLKAIAQLIKTSEGIDSKRYSMIHIHLSDSLINNRQSAKNQFAKIRYDDALTKEENSRLKLEKEKIASINLLILVAGVLTLIIVILLFVILRAQHKKQNREQIYKTEQLISKKIHDVLANDLYNVMTFAKSNRIENNEKKEVLLRYLNGIYLATRDIAHQTGTIETGENYGSNLTEMMQLYNDQETHIASKGLENLQWELFSVASKRTIYRLIQELLVNMKKHSKANLVFFDFNLVDKKLIVGYKDNGIDFQHHQEVLKKVLQNVENHINGIGGQVIFDSISGRVNIKVPIK